ncbi:MAG: helix-turn-helix transcriptional regulator [Reichenbachiella sp.]|uniref:helix-turn-helix domain-containing protein n=1 Tax=Reichenbachiella sp. TaxID=2184521 RepID=UPI0029675BAB|nr:helix-turn-helix transcriptional regulator [Reichenbachiella sp.]MDW3210298.1 helix-turn-helix transcriptional regulator [Reichenbachiella sp.]
MKDEKAIDDLLKALGARLKELRKKGGFTGGYVGFAIHQLEMQPKQYWEIEEGHANITMKTLIKVLKPHNITLEEFFKGL